MTYQSKFGQDKHAKESSNFDMRPTPGNHSLALKSDGFNSLAEALEYASQGESGFNFYDHRGDLSASFTYRELHREARILARKLVSLGCPRGTRVGIIAETDPLFHRFFFACQFAGLIPVALPAGIQLGAHKAYVGQIRRMLKGCGAEIAVAPQSHVAFLNGVAEMLDLTMSGTSEDFDLLPEDDAELVPLSGNETAYLQYTSGSTRFPRGVEIDQNTAINNLQEIATHGLKLNSNDRFVSWLPFYHDMGMIGFILVPLICQLSADYLASRTFAMRPRLWLKIISDNKGTISSSPTFGYALCAKRLRPSDYERYDLSSWRAACVGAEQIKPQPLMEFANALAPCGFDRKAFVACYGMAETVLAVSFAPLDLGLRVDIVNQDIMGITGEAIPVAPDHENAAGYVDCGVVLPGFEFKICDPDGIELADRECGIIYLKGPSVMQGYFQDELSTRSVMSREGWLDTGDIGYRIESNLVITARSKDVIIIKGRNIWPHDLETIVERLSDVRMGGVAAFSAPETSEEERAVMVVETRYAELEDREALVHSITELMHEYFGINVEIDLVRPGTLPRTSSGKLSRSLSKEGYLARLSGSTSTRYNMPYGARKIA
jgi:fatty-acyl-CoA synthase